MKSIKGEQIYSAWEQAFTDDTIGRFISPEIKLAAEGIDIDSQAFANAMRKYIQVFYWEQCIRFPLTASLQEKAAIIAKIKHMTDLAKKLAPDGKPLLASSPEDAAELLYRVSEQIGCAMPCNAGTVPELDAAIKELVKAIINMIDMKA